jgi:hypothetical protein
MNSMFPSEPSQSKNKKKGRKKRIESTENEKVRAHSSS